VFVDSLEHGRSLTAAGWINVLTILIVDVTITIQIIPFLFVILLLFHIEIGPGVFVCPVIQLRI